MRSSQYCLVSRFMMGEVSHLGLSKNFNSRLINFKGRQSYEKNYSHDIRLFLKNINEKTAPYTLPANISNVYSLYKNKPYKKSTKIKINI